MWQDLTKEMRLFKADIDAAFRRIPIMPGHRQYAGVLFKEGGQTWFAKHAAMPFGAIASVHAWDRVGAFLRELGRKLLHLALFRYVDDFFAPDWDEVIENAKDTFARCASVAYMCIAGVCDLLQRLVRACLGQGAISERKLESGNGLVILGVVIDIDETGFTMWPSPDKIVKWSKQINAALEAKRLTAGEASKLSGALQWACQSAFKSIGRAMIRPLISQVK